MEPDREWLLRFALDHVRRAPMLVDPDRTALLFALRAPKKLLRELSVHADADWVTLFPENPGEHGGRVLHVPIDGMALTLMGYPPRSSGATRALLVTSSSRGVTHLPWARDREEHIGSYLLEQLNFDRREGRPLAR